MAEPPWGRLEPLEQELLDAAAKGRPCRPVTQDDATTQADGAGQMIRAEVLRHLLVDEQWPVDPRGIELHSVLIHGFLDLQSAAVRCPARFEDCRFDFDGPVMADLATIPFLSFRTCQLPGLSARTSVITKGLDLSHSTVTGPVVLTDADITGGLVCESTTLKGIDEQGRSLHADRLKVSGALQLTGKFSAAGTVSLVDADITGPLQGSGAAFHAAGKDGYALNAPGLKVGSGAYLTECTATGKINLLDAQITGQLSFRGADISGVAEVCLEGDRLTASGGAWFDQDFTSSGPIRLSGANIAGQLSFFRATINKMGASGPALTADGIKVGSGLTFGEVSATGALVLSSAKVTGWLILDKARIDGSASNGMALIADGLAAGSGVSAEESCTRGGVVLTNASIAGRLSFAGAKINALKGSENANVAAALRAGRGITVPPWSVTPGAVQLSNAVIAGQLSFAKAEITSIDTTGNALIANGLHVADGIYLNQGFSAAGAVTLTDATITGELNLEQARLTGPDTKSMALIANRMTVTGDLLLQAFTSAGDIGLAGAQISGELRWFPGEVPGWKLDLSGAFANRLADDGKWPKDGRLKIAGFTYNGLSGDPGITWQDRRDWIRGQYPPRPAAPVAGEQPGQPPPADAARPARFATQPYKQLASVYASAGQDSDARQINIAAQADRRKYGKVDRRAWLANWLYDVTIKYGYQAWRAVLGLVAVYGIVLIALLFAQPHKNLIIPTGNISGLKSAPTAQKCQAGYPCFYPAGFAVDTVVPLINVHQADSWAINGDAPWGWAWEGGLWVATGLGWALATLFVAGYTGIVRPD